MKYLLAAILLLTMHAAEAQIQGVLMGMRGAQAAYNLSHLKRKPNSAKGKAKEKAEEAPAVVLPPVKLVAPVSYRGQSFSHQRTPAAQLKGKGQAEILALEALLDETHADLLADSTQSFLPAARYEATVAAARTAAAARPSWDYAPYQNELAFYQQEEARRQLVLNPPPPAPVKPVRKPPVKRGK
ncbi:hypothetical protein [Hymenobacter chitinivorans]|uniref:Uncharacterized protein n=1 Tax=Hymenobacter chitinivorans DSM 11115 TaxID=1121954 RepID=A0A2M9BST5_9BACT|nr:hypothetical protein [Hymenobacter chitinivorans]PJJ61019.1 hypothetical protein CLV45_2456 [Hymenobacter chitinivorans DSM 11115]